MESQQQHHDVFSVEQIKIINQIPILDVLKFDNGSITYQSSRLLVKEAFKSMNNNIAFRVYFKMNPGDFELTNEPIKCKYRIEWYIIIPQKGVQEEYHQIVARTYLKKGSEDEIFDNLKVIYKYMNKKKDFEKKYNFVF